MNIGIIFAGGTGQRMRTKERPKQFLEICNKPIIIYTLEHFEKCEDIDWVVVVCIEEWIPYLKDLLYKYRIEKVKRIVKGGKTGQLSIYNGLNAAEDIADGEETIVLIHDGVRPLISSKLLSQNIQSVKKNGATITTSIVKETAVIVSETGVVESIPRREMSRVAKAPQSFWLKDILKVHKAALSDGKDNYIDSCTMMKEYGYNLCVLDGPSENIKITTPEDFYEMRAILEAKENAQIYGIEEYYPKENM